MPKMKSNRAAMKRFIVCGSGRIKRKHAYKSHILTKKETKRKRNLTKVAGVHRHNMPIVRELILR